MEDILNGLCLESFKFLEPGKDSYKNMYSISAVSFLS